MVMKNINPKSFKSFQTNLQEVIYPIKQFQHDRFIYETESTYKATDETFCLPVQIKAQFISNRNLREPKEKDKKEGRADVETIVNCRMKERDIT